MAPYNLDSAIRKIPDFPKPGILFYDVTGILVEPEAFRFCVDCLTERARRAGSEAVAVVEARGFVFGSPVAAALGVPLVLVRKKGKLPGKTFSKSFSLEYGEDSIEVHRADLAKKRRFVIIDDLVATGGTLKAASDLLLEAGSEVAAILAVIGLPFLHYEKVLGGIPVTTLVDYHGE